MKEEWSENRKEKILPTQEISIQLTKAKFISLEFIYEMCCQIIKKLLYWFSLTDECHAEKVKVKNNSLLLVIGKHVV